jgi:3-oxoacyl-[acyl-carrier-protein] synthase-3
MSERGDQDGRTPYEVRITSVGRSLPNARLTTAELMASTRHRTRIDLERLTGIRERRVVDATDNSLSLAVAAGRDCLQRADRAAGDIDLVVSCSITKYIDGLEHRLEPTMALSVARALGTTDAITFDVANACAGTLTGVFVASNWIRTGMIERALVVSGEYISQLGRNAARHVRSIMSPELASLTLGDAGAAVLVERAPAGAGLVTYAGFTTVADHSRLCLAGPARHDPGARMFTRSRALQRAAIAATPLLLDEALSACGLDISEIDYVIPHQTSARAISKGMRILSAQLGAAPRNPAVITVDRYGNTASTTHVVALAEELRAGRIHAGDRVALIALASGLEIGVVVFTVDEELARNNGYAD